MSYVRMGPDSDVYVFRSTDGYECQGDSKHHPTIATHDSDFVIADAFVTKDLPLLIAHLLGHRIEGQKVPSRAFQRLLEEIS